MVTDTSATVVTAATSAVVLAESLAALLSVPPSPGSCVAVAVKVWVPAAPVVQLKFSVAVPPAATLLAVRVWIVPSKSD